MQKVAFHSLMRRLIKQGTLHLVDHLGHKQSFHGSEDLPTVTAHIHSPKLYARLLLHPDLALGEAYMDGEITIENGTIYDFLLLLAGNINNESSSFIRRIHILAIIQQWCTSLVNKISPKVAKANVAHHYDLSPKLYDLFLDRDRQYSCAYFHTIDNSLEEAQLDKKRHLAAKLNLKSGNTVLDIGCGWGGLALYLAQVADVKVVGLTLSEEQFKVANQRAQNAGMSDRVTFLLQDYREVTGNFDRIVSVGMFEHVGVKHYPEFFAQVQKLLSDDGIALLHSIGVAYDPGMSSRWINKYIFPGGYIPVLSEVIPVIEKHRLRIADIELLHHHYAATLQAWRERFLANLDKLPPDLDKRFINMWEYYLAGSQVSFQKLGLMNFQIQLMKNIEAIPLTRDYMLLCEQKLKDINYSPVGF